MTDYINVKGKKVYCKHTGKLCFVVNSPEELVGFEGCATCCDIPMDIAIENRAEMESYKDYPDDGEF